MRSRRRGGVCAATRLASQPKQGVSRDRIETDMIPIGDGNDIGRISTKEFVMIETDMIPIGDGNDSPPPCRESPYEN